MANHGSPSMAKGLEDRAIFSPWRISTKPPDATSENQTNFRPSPLPITPARAGLSTLQLSACGPAEPNRDAAGARPVFVFDIIP